MDVNLAICANSPATTLKHKGRLNAPIVDEIAISLPSSDVITQKYKRYVTINYRQKPGTNQLDFIPDCHRSYDSLQYPLLFPNGQGGWHYVCLGTHMFATCQFSNNGKSERPRAC